MSKLMVERPRGGGRIRIKRRKENQKSNWIAGDAPKRESMSHARGTKWLSENFAPLIRFLRSQRGQPWDKVYSQIAEQLRPTNAVQKHVLDHLEQFVTTETWLENGRPVGRLHWKDRTPLDRPCQFRDRFFVCPKTGRLKEVPYRSRRNRKTERTPDVRWLAERVQIRRIDQIWYAFELDPVPRDPAKRTTTIDCLTNRTIGSLHACDQYDSLLARLYGSRLLFAARKRQLGKKELRNLNAYEKAPITMAYHPAKATH